ncbi:MAG: hypothetical protein P8Z76_02280 [Alphaproteobacteria bacterium]
MSNSLEGTAVYFLVFSGPAEAGAAFRAWFAEGPSHALAALDGLRAYDLYTPEASHDPYLDDGPGPLAMAQLYFDDLRALEAALASSGFPAAAARCEGTPIEGLTAVHEAMEAHFYPVEGESEPSPLPTVPSCSYVVRYHRPAEDEATFVTHYVKHHPPILGEFPNIRNVMCYLPVEWSDPVGVPRADYMLGNEVVFDTVDDLNASLRSDVRHKLRDDYKTFPPFTGRNTHYAMRRERIVG